MRDLFILYIEKVICDFKMTYQVIEYLGLLPMKLTISLVLEELHWLDDEMILHDAYEEKRYKLQLK